MPAIRPGSGWGNQCPEHVAGDFLLALELHANTQLTSGWTSIANAATSWAYDAYSVGYRFATSSSTPAPFVTATINTRVYAISGVHTQLPVVNLVTGQSSSGVSEVGSVAVPGALASSGSAYFFGGTTTVGNHPLLQMGTGDFCIECWLYPVRAATETPVYRGLGISGTTQGLSLDGSRVTYVGGPNITSTNNYVLNQWNHIAATRTAGTLRLFLNGVLQGTVSDTTNYNLAASLTLGNREPNHPYANYPFKGYISNFRVVKGNSVYTSSFTPPQAPLSAISGTSLLTCASPDSFQDASGNGLTPIITTAGSQYVTPNSPFASMGDALRFTLVGGYAGGGNPPYSGYDVIGGPGISAFAPSAYQSYGVFIIGGVGPIRVVNNSGYGGGGSMRFVSFALNPRPSSFFAMF